MLKKVSGSAIAIAIAVGWAMPAQAQDATSAEAEIAQMRAQMQAMAARIDALQSQLDATKSQADAAATAANQAATTAAAANETATAAKASKADLGSASWAADTKISGRMYFNMSTISADDAAGNNVQKGGGFEFKRFYVGIDHKFNDVLSGNITTDVTSANGSGAQLYVKKAYLRANFSKALDVRLGATDMPWIPYVEGIYGHRYIENTLTDLDKFGTSSDWGVHVQGKLADGLVNYQVSATNGAGYKTIKMTKSIDLEGRLALSYHGFNAAIGGHTGKLGKDDGTTTNLKTANRFDALLAYKGKVSAVPFTIGGEYFHATNWNNVTGAISPTMDISSEGYSIFASIQPVDKWGVFGRYDWVKPNKELAPLQVNHYFNVGVEYSPAKIVDIALVYKRDSGDDGIAIGHLGSGQATRDEFGIYSRFRW
ncbi:hypothetical protein [Tsuneonella mangrovi]|uniref:hypothetical protein n=1 Tax=Tsuneonella mangrovi TaxID=1982042 RepID=UPI000BA20F51|nr:hypothetical protein [Tsuneonella mangrovi]